MFGPKLTTVFASRWRAIWFSLSVLLFAWMTVPAEEPDANSADATMAEVKKVSESAGLSKEGQEQVDRTLKNLAAISGNK